MYCFHYTTVALFTSKISPDELKKNEIEEQKDPNEIPDAKEEGEEPEEEVNDNISNLPTEKEIEIEDQYGKAYFIVPENIQPVMELSTIEVLIIFILEIISGYS